MSGHFHSRKHSWSRLREAALEVLKSTAPRDDLSYDLWTLLFCILGASGVGLAIALLYYLGRGLLG